MKMTRSFFFRTLLMAATALSFSSLTGCFCGSGNKSGGADASVHNLNDKAGSASIEFHNNLIEFTKTARDPLRKIMSTLKDSMEFIQYQTTRPMWNLVLIGNNPLEKVMKSKLTAPSAFPKSEQEFFNTRIAQVKKDAEVLNKHVGELAAYYKAEDFKDDKHQKVKDLQSVITSLVESIATTCGEMNERSEKIASAAERKTLEKIPQGIFILNMRDIMAKVEQQIELFDDERLLRKGSGTERRSEASKAEAAANVKDITDKLDALSAEIKEMGEKMRKINTSKISKRLADNYADFFKQLDDQQGTIRQKNRFIKEWGYAGNEGDIRTTIGSYKSLVNAHNHFIDTSNKE